MHTPKPKKNNQETQLPLVSVVIPTFNQGQYLPACIDHCLFQTYQNLELIIVDGGSSDNTKEYLATLEDAIRTQKMEPVSHLSENNELIRRSLRTFPQDRDIQIITFNDDIGATRTYNEGLRKASGKYCTYVVGDDLPHPHMIEEMVPVLENHDVDFVYSDMNLVDDNGRIIRQMRQPDYDFTKCLSDWFHLGVSKLYRTELHERGGLMDENYTAANDYDHYLRFAMAGCRFYRLPKVLYSVRYHGPERKTGQHTPGRYRLLLEESKKCALRARRFWQKQKI